MRAVVRWQLQAVVVYGCNLKGLDPLGGGAPTSEMKMPQAGLNTRRVAFITCWISRCRCPSEILYIGAVSLSLAMTSHCQVWS